MSKVANCVYGPATSSSGEDVRRTEIPGHFQQSPVGTNSALERNASENMVSE